MITAEMLRIYWWDEAMIVSEVMTTRLITVTPDDTLSHAANLLRQYQFHHLPVIKSGQGYFGVIDTTRGQRPVFEGLLTSQDIDVAAAVGTSSSDILHRPWQERRVLEVMHRASIRVTPTTGVAAAAQILVERGLNCLPVVEYESPASAMTNEPAAGTTQAEQTKQAESPEQALLVGLLTRSDLLMALARALGSFEPGMQLSIPLPMGDLAPLVSVLQIAGELHIQVRSVLAAPLEGPVPLVATVRLGTIHPAPLLERLQAAQIQYTFTDDM
jgi:acetoin utilization protein AcuB